MKWGARDRYSPLLQSAWHIDFRPLQGGVSFHFEHRLIGHWFSMSLKATPLHNLGFSRGGEGVREAD